VIRDAHERSAQECGEIGSKLLLKKHKTEGSTAELAVI
jgi:hypothetical protein